MTTLHVLLIAQAIASFGMFGLIWLIQLAHYPLQIHVPADRFVAYQAAHLWRVTVVVGPLMLAELIVAVWLVQLQLHGSMLLAAWIGVALVAIIWISTAVLQIPCHFKLERGRDEAAIRTLVRTNWIRTLAWTGRAGIATWMLILNME